MKLNISDKLLDDIDVIVQYQNSLLIHMIAAEYKDKCNAKDLTKPSGNWHLRPCSSKHMISGAQVRRNSRLK